MFLLIDSYFVKMNVTEDENDMMLVLFKAVPVLTQALKICLDHGLQPKSVKLITTLNGTLVVYVSSLLCNLPEQQAERAALSVAKNMVQATNFGKEITKTSNVKNGINAAIGAIRQAVNEGLQGVDILTKEKILKTFTDFLVLFTKVHPQTSVSSSQLGLSGSGAFDDNVYTTDWIFGSGFPFKRKHFKLEGGNDFASLLTETSPYFDYMVNSSYGFNRTNMSNATYGLDAINMSNATYGLNGTNMSNATYGLNGTNMSNATYGLNGTNSTMDYGNTSSTGSTSTASSSEYAVPSIWSSLAHGVVGGLTPLLTRVGMNLAGSLYQSARRHLPQGFQQFMKPLEAAWYNPNVQRYVEQIPEYAGALVKGALQQRSTDRFINSVLRSGQAKVDEHNRVKQENYEGAVEKENLRVQTLDEENKRKFEQSKKAWNVKLEGLDAEANKELVGKINEIKTLFGEASALINHLPTDYASNWAVQRHYGISQKELGETFGAKLKKIDELIKQLPKTKIKYINDDGTEGTKLFSEAFEEEKKPLEGMFASELNDLTTAVAGLDKTLATRLLESSTPKKFIDHFLESRNKYMPVVAFIETVQSVGEKTNSDLPSTSLFRLVDKINNGEYTKEYMEKSPTDVKVMDPKPIEPVKTVRNYIPKEVKEIYTPDPRLLLMRNAPMQQAFAEMAAVDARTPLRGWQTQLPPDDLAFIKANVPKPSVTTVSGGPRGRTRGLMMNRLPIKITSSRMFGIQPMSQTTIRASRKRAGKRR